MRRFEGQTAIITGGSRGIGLGVARRLGQEGARVLITATRQDTGAPALAALKDEGIEAMLAVGNVAEESHAREVVQQAMDAWGRVDVLFTNAGTTAPTANLWESPIEELDRNYAVNVRGTFLFCKYVIPHMLDRKYGRIVVMSSIAGKEGNPRASAYSATKAAVIGLTKSLGKELAETRITVNCLTPSTVDTDMPRQATPEQRKYMLDKVPMHRVLAVEEVAALTAWIASPECSATTAAVFDISGGRATY